MEEQLNKYFSDFEKLLKTKDYNMLSDSERSIVGRFSTEGEYNRMRKIILLNSEISIEERKTVKPDPNILNGLVNKMKSNKASSGRVRNIFEYRIPAYQFAIYAAASIIVFILIFNREKTVSVQKPVYVCKTDTVEKYIVKENQSNIQKPAQINYSKTDEKVNINNEKSPAITQIPNHYNSSLNNFELPGTKFDIKDKIEGSRPKGRTMLDDSSIVKYFVTI